MRILGKSQLITITITFSFFAIISTAKAAPTPDPGFGSFLVDLVQNFLVNPTDWLKGIWDTVGPAGINLPKIIQFLSIALLLLGIIWSGLRIVSLGSSIELQSFFVRALLAGALVTSGPWMGELLRQTWVDCYTWSHEKITKPTTDKAIDELTNLGITLTALSAAYITAPAIGEAAKAALGKNVKEATSDAMDGIKNNAGTVMELVKYVLFSVGAIVTVEYVVVILTGFAIIIASLMIPFAGVMLIFPGNAMQSWFATWFRSASGALLLVLLHPIAYVAALQIGFIEPAKRFNTSLSGTVQKLQDAVDKLKSLIPSGIDLTKVGEWFNNAWNAVTGSLQDVASAGTTLLFGTITSIVMLFIGIAFAVLFVYAAQTQIMAFIGSIVGGGAGRGANMTPLAAAGAGFAGAAMGVASGAGEMGQLAMNKFTGGGGAPSSTPGGDSGGGGSGGGGSGGGGRGPNESADAYSDRLSQEQNDWAKNDFDERLANSSGSGGGQPGGPQAGGGQPGGPQGGGGSSGGPRAGGGQGGPRAGGGGSSGGATAAEVGEVAEEAGPLLLL